MSNSLYNLLLTIAYGTVIAIIWYRAGYKNGVRDAKRRKA